jgi:hypothetical protein
MQTPVLGRRWLAGSLCGLENQWRKPRLIPWADSGDALCAAHLHEGVVILLHMPTCSVTIGVCLLDLG